MLQLTVYCECWRWHFWDPSECFTPNLAYLSSGSNFSQIKGSGIEIQITGDTSSEVTRRIRNSCVQFARREVRLSSQFLFIRGCIGEFGHVNEGLLDQLARRVTLVAGRFPVSAANDFLQRPSPYAGLINSFWPTWMGSYGRFTSTDLKLDSIWRIVLKVPLETQSFSTLSFSVQG